MLRDVRYQRLKRTYSEKNNIILTSAENQHDQPFKCNKTIPLVTPHLLQQRLPTQPSCFACVLEQSFSGAAYSFTNCMVRAFFSWLRRCVVRSHSNPWKTVPAVPPKAPSPPHEKQIKKRDSSSSAHRAPCSPELNRASPSHRSKCTQFGTGQPIQILNSGLLGTPRRATVVFAGRLHMGFVETIRFDRGWGGLDSR